MNGENASSSILTGRLGSLNCRCASGYCAVNSAVAMRLNPGELFAPRPSWPSYGRQYPCFEDPRDRLGIPGFDPDRGKRILRRKALVRPVENLPIAQLAAPSERQASSSDATQREGKHLELIA